MDQLKIQAISSELLTALDNGRTIPSIVERNPGFGWEDGYRVAAEILRMRRARCERTVGRRIGFTNRNIRAEVGATAPIWLTCTTGRWCGPRTIAPPCR